MSGRTLQFVPWDRGVILVYKMECKDGKIYLDGELSRGMIVEIKTNHDRPTYPVIVISDTAIVRDDGGGVGEAAGFGNFLGQVYIGRGDLNLQALTLLKPEDIARLYDPDRPFYRPVETY